MKAMKRAFLSKLLFIFHYLVWKLGLFSNLRFGWVCQKRIFTVSTLCTNVPLYQNTNLLHGTKNSEWLKQHLLLARISFQLMQTTVFITRLNEGNSLVYIVKAGEIIGRKKFKLALRSPRHKLPQRSWWWIITENFLLILMKEKRILKPSFFFPQITPYNLKGAFLSDKQKCRVFYFVMHLVNGRILPDSIIINLDFEVLGQPHEAYSVKTRIKCLNLGNNNE